MLGRMPFYDDHPVRLVLLRRGLKQSELAKLAGITTGAVDKLVMGMTKSVNPKIGAVLWQRYGVDPQALQAAVDEWQERPIVERLPPRARATLSLAPEDISRFYVNFREWRAEFADNPTHFASLVRVARATVKEFEDGQRAAFPPALHTALVATFGLSDEYVLALGRLPFSQPVS